MTENNFNLSEFHHSIYLKCTAEEAYRFAASADGLCKWFMGSAVYSDTNGNNKAKNETAQSGDTFSWQWLKKDLKIDGKVIDAVKNEKFSFTFGNSFIVTISIKQLKGRILFTLHQAYNKDAEQNDFAHINCCVCWTFFMTNLKSVVEHGNDLRETLEDDESLLNR